VRFTSRSSQKVLAGRVLFAVCLFTIAAVSVTQLVRRGSIVPAGKPNVAMTGLADDAPHYTGSIIIPAPGSKLCRHLLFDNVTGQIRETDAGECATLDVNSTEGRIGAIRRSFAGKPNE
jgi:hypothetical protein